MSDKTTHVFKSSKSMPVEYRLMDLDSADKSTNSKVDDDDSLYGYSPSPRMDDKDENPSVSQQNSILPSRGWDDISVYNAKKVMLVITLLPVLCIIYCQTNVCIVYKIASHVIKNALFSYTILCKVIVHTFIICHIVDIY